ncbi:unnamed protein product [Adineta steineri]|uniref:Uncharacterized protein n=1 Tax=Adineta steineri TaxID=433720 RepID=A0A814W7X2_9BILA|nr:unnamed protein product [Adineta steineri]CAF4083966.1 unnamed protein product [Adineta steineri]
MNDTDNRGILAEGGINIHVYTLVKYKNHFISVHESKSNEGGTNSAGNVETLKFFYVPLMFPIQTPQLNMEWITIAGKDQSEVRLSLITGNDELEQLIENEIKKDSNKQGHNIKVAPLLINSLTAIITNGNDEPVAGVHPSRIINPSQIILTLRFQCTSKEVAENIIEGILDGDYNIEFAIYFAGLHTISMNMIMITSDTLKKVLSSTTAEGGNTKAQFIHRKQATNFVAGYTANVKKTIYIENPNANVSQLISSLEDEFKTLIQQAMDHAEKTQLDANLFDQIWSSSDLNPDIIRSDLNKIFTYNKTLTDYANSSDILFHYDKKEAEASDTKGKIQIGWDFFGGSAEASHAQTSSNQLNQTNHDIVTQKDIKDFLTQQNIETQWSGEKWEPKSFNVYKLTDITDRLQVALVAKQLTAEKTNGAEMKVINIMDVPIPGQFIGSCSTEKPTEITTTTVPSTLTTTPLMTTTRPSNSFSANGQYKKFEWYYCNNIEQQVNISNFDVTPMPLYRPGDAKFTLIADLKRDLKQVIKTRLTMFRRISGITFPNPIQCMMMGGSPIGSCEYDDLCVMFQRFSSIFKPDNCPSELLKHGIDCKCPFNIRTQRLDIDQLFSLKSFDGLDSFLNFMRVGDYKVVIEASDIDGPLTCLELYFTIIERRS